MEYDLKALEDAGFSTEDGIGYTGSKEKYISAIQRYFKNYESNKKTLTGYYDSEDWENYGIKVHSLKSNSRMIGALALGDSFEELEMAAREGNTGLIKEKNGAVLKMYENVIEVIRPIGEAEAALVSGEIGAEEAKKLAAEVLGALEDYDDEKAKELAIKLSGYPFRITQSGKLKEAIKLINDFMYDEAADLIREIIPAIE